MAEIIDPITGEVTVTDEQGVVIDQGFEEPGPVTTALAPVPTSATSVNESAQAYKDYGAETALADSGPYADYVNPAAGIADVDVATGTSFSTPETTVAGQLEKLLDKGGPLQQQAQRRAREQAGALNMMSSSAAIGAARREDITALLPVAAQDAETAAKFKLQEQQVRNEISKIQVEAEVSGELNRQKAEINEQAKRIEMSWQSVMKGLDEEAQAALEDQRQEWAIKIRTLEGDITRELRQQEIDAEVETQIITTAADAMNNYQITIQNLLANESFLDNFAGDSDAMKAYFDDLFVTVESSIRYSAKAAGVYWDETTQTGLKPFIDDLVAENQWA